MRTTIRLDDALLREAKTRAAQTGRTLTAVIEDALRASLQRSSERPERPIPVFEPVRHAGLQPGVDLSDSAALLDLMEGTRH
jgi:hypothetical protein